MGLERGLPDGIQRADRLVVADAADGFSEHVGHREDGDFAALLLVGDRVGEDHLLEAGVGNALRGGIGHDSVAGHRADGLGAVLLEQVGCTGDGASRVHNVVDKKDVLALHVAEDLHVADLVGLQAPLVADHHRQLEELRVAAGALRAAHVGRGYNEVVEGQLLADVV